MSEELDMLQRMKKIQDESMKTLDECKQLQNMIKCSLRGLNDISDILHKTKENLSKIQG